jgi:heme o synthase
LPSPRLSSRETTGPPLANTEPYPIETAEPVRAGVRPAVTGLAFVRDLVILTKPRITALVLLTAAAGAEIAPGHAPRANMALALLATALIVGSANALNMWWERDVDACMARTKTRPLPAGRMSPDVALAFALTLGAASVPMLFAVNVATGALGLIALVTYVLLYTPLKRKSHLALLVGAVPGAMPPLLGWTSVTGTVDLRGLCLFAVLFVWQVPHFAAITLFRAEEYARAGLMVISVQKGERAAKKMIFGSTVVLVAASALPYVARVAGAYYLGIAALLGAAFLGLAAQGLRTGADRRWAKRTFAFSIAYLVIVMAALLLDRASP